MLYDSQEMEIIYDPKERKIFSLNSGLVLAYDKLWSLILFFVIQLKRNAKFTLKTLVSILYWIEVEVPICLWWQ